jgi:threonine/homoserine/homoserine lactone efflux protein
MSLTTIAGFWAISLLMAIIPGADWAYVISAGLRRRRLVLPAVIGLASGSLLATLTVASGVGPLVAQSHSMMIVFMVAGAAYLLWLGISTWHNAVAASPSVNHISDIPWRWAIKGASISGLNPKLILLLMTLLPQFVRPSAAWSITTQILALGTIHASSCCLVYFGVGLASQRMLSARPSAALFVSRLSGGLMIGLAVLLLVESTVY